MKVTVELDMLGDFDKGENPSFVCEGTPKKIMEQFELLMSSGYRLIISNVKE